MGNPEQSEVDWSAFRYTADEMTDAERAAFELLLADDQRAREAVEHAVELREALGLVFSESADERRNGSPRHRIVFWGASLAASAALMFFAYRLVSNRDAPRDNRHTVRNAEAAPTSASSVSISLAWAEVRNRTNGDGAAAETSDWNPDLTLPEPFAPADATVIDETANDIPHWLLAAVEADNDRNKELP